MVILALIIKKTRLIGSEFELLRFNRFDCDLYKIIKLCYILPVAFWIGYIRVFISDLRANLTYVSPSYQFL